MAFAEGGSKRNRKVTRLGFEPRLTVPKTGVLPLHYRALRLMREVLAKTGTGLNRGL